MKIYHHREYLVEQLKTKNYIQISKENGVDISTIQRHMRRHKLTKKRVSWTKEELFLLKQNYENNISVYDLFPNRTISSINHKASELKYEKTIKKRIYSTNHDFFKDFNPEMAYVLGWFFSDGNVSSKKYCISLHLNIKDKYILEKIGKLMKSNHPISDHSDSSYLRINSKVISKDLINLKCPPRKSLILEFPNVPDKYLAHFVRGFFDGDGSIHFNKPNVIVISFISTKRFIDELQKKLKRILGLPIHPLQKHHKVYIARYYGTDARTLCYWMYENSKSLYLIRKRLRFENHIKMREEYGI